MKLLRNPTEGYVHDGSGDPMEVQEGDRADYFGDRTESGQVYTNRYNPPQNYVFFQAFQPINAIYIYILVKPVLTS